MKRIMVSGGTGFIGSHFVSYVLSKKFEIWVLVRQHTARQESKNLKFITLEELNLLVSTNNLPDFELVVHLATFYKQEYDESEIQNAVEAIISIGTTMLLVAHKSECKFLYTSSYLQYLPESTLAPQYVSLKNGFKANVEIYDKFFPLNSTEAILGDTIGEGDKRNKITKKLISAKLDNKDFTLDNPQNLMMLTSVEDVCAGLWNLRNTIPGSTYLVSNRFTITIETLDKLVNSIFNGIVVPELELKSLSNLNPIFEKFQSPPEWQTLVPISNSISRIIKELRGER